MRRVLLDENLPRKLRRALNEFSVRTVQEEGWTSFTNGELLLRAQDQFDVLLTAGRTAPGASLLKKLGWSWRGSDPDDALISAG